MKNNYLKETLMVLVATILVLLVIGIIPDFEFKYIHFNLLADILQADTLITERTDDETIVSLPEEEQVTAKRLQDSLANVKLADILQADTFITERSNDKTIVSLPEEEQVTAKRLQNSLTNVKDQPIVNNNSSTSEVMIEDYSSDKKTLLPFYKALQNNIKTRPVRIGVLGDSFIEADIITAKLRKLLQSKYGGTGVGFVPISSPAAQYRNTIHHTFSNWTTYSMVYYKKADWNKFCLSGLYFTPNKEGASVTMKTVKGEAVTMISFFFINEKKTRISVTINNQEPVEYRPESSEFVQQLVFSNPAIKSVSVRTNHIDGFTAFGMYLNNPSGVYVDNFSVRGSSGSVLTTLSKELSTQLTQHVPYDLLIIQYGLNVITPNKKRGYATYQKMMQSAIARLQECYPGVPILMMSIGDKGTKGSDGVTTHPGVVPLMEAQRQMARKAGIAFWNTYKAMGGEKSMVEFVNNKPPMAAKDYTHINYLGGEKIADQLFKSLMIEQKRLAP